jgi:hypothetical protein
MSSVAARPEPLRLLAAAVSLPLLALGLGAMFAPDRMLNLLDLAPRGVYGYNTIRSDIGGMLIGSALLILIGVRRRERAWLLSAAVIMALLLVGRVVSFALDGMTSAATPAIIVELVVIAVMLVTSQRFGVSATR